MWIPQKAVLWANQAYSVEPNSPAAGALLAYALGMNNQLSWAKPLLTSFEHTQIADLVQAQIHIADGDKTNAIQTLRDGDRQGRRLARRREGQGNAAAVWAASTFRPSTPQL